MPPAKAIRIGLLMLFAVMLGACVSARPVVEWRDEAFTGRFDRLLVIAVVEDPALRRTVEDAYAGRFADLGVAVIPGYTVVADIAALSRETVEAAIAGRDIDAVMVTRLLGVEEVEQYHPPSYYDYYDRYDSFFRYSLPRSGPGYYTRFTLLKLETNLYDTATAELVWSLRSESMDSPAPADVIEGQVGLTAKRLLASGLLGPEQ
jgi:hypothetical protein